MEGLDDQKAPSIGLEQAIEICTRVRSEAPNAADDWSLAYGYDFAAAIDLLRQEATRLIPINTSPDPKRPRHKKSVTGEIPAAAHAYLELARNAEAWLKRAELELTNSDGVPDVKDNPRPKFRNELKPIVSGDLCPPATVEGAAGRITRIAAAQIITTINKFDGLEPQTVLQMDGLAMHISIDRADRRAAYATRQKKTTTFRSYRGMRGNKKKLIATQLDYQRERTGRLKAHLEENIGAPQKDTLQVVHIADQGGIWTPEGMQIVSNSLVWDGEEGGLFLTGSPDEVIQAVRANAAIILKIYGLD